MHGGGGGLFAQGLKSHTMIGLVFTGERHGRRESRAVNPIWYTAVACVLGYKRISGHIQGWLDIGSVSRLNAPRAP